MPRLFSPVLVCATPLLLAGCPLPTACTMEARQTLSVRVYDRATGAPAALGARGEVRDGEYRDTLVVLSPNTMAPMDTWERPGRYEVTVEKPGYASARRDVRVGAGRCHVRTATVRVDLDPLP